MKDRKCASVQLLVLVLVLLVLSSSRTVSADPIFNVTLQLWVDPTQCYHKCIPNGVCALETKACYNKYDNSTDSGSDNTAVLPDCKFRCACNVGFTGNDCATEVQVCGGHFPQSIMTQYALTDDLNVVCYNGGKCVENIEIGGDTTYTCDCSDIADEASIQNSPTGSITTYNGLQCEYSQSISCVRDQQFSSTNYCVNGGICLQYVNDDTDIMLPCQCPASKYEGRHCQYKYGTAPQIELDYVRNKLLEEEQRIEDQQNANKQQQQQNADGTGGSGGGVSTVGIVFMVLLAIIISCVGCFYAYRHGLRRHEVTSDRSTGTFRGSKRRPSAADDPEAVQFDQAFDITDDDIDTNNNITKNNNNGVTDNTTTTSPPPGDGKEII